MAKTSGSVNFLTNLKSVDCNPKTITSRRTKIVSFNLCNLFVTELKRAKSAECFLMGILFLVWCFCSFFCSKKFGTCQKPKKGLDLENRHNKYGACKTVNGNIFSIEFQTQMHSRCQNSGSALSSQYILFNEIWQIISIRCNCETSRLV